MMKTNKDITVPLEELIEKLSTEDKKYARLSRRMQIMYLLLIPFFAVMMIIEYVDERNIYSLFWGLSNVLAFSIFAILFGKYYKQYNQINYALPTLQMLKQAAYRYHPLRKHTLWAVVAIIIMDIGMIFYSLDDESIWPMQFFFLGAVAVGIVVGLSVWYVKYRPLRVNALMLIREIEGD